MIQIEYIMHVDGAVFIQSGAEVVQNYWIGRNEGGPVSRAEDVGTGEWTRVLGRVMRIQSL